MAPSSFTNWRGGRTPRRTNGGRSPASGRTRWRGGGCGATTPRSRSAAIFLVIVAMCLLRAGVREAHRAHHARTPTTSPTGHGRRQADATSSRPTGIPIGPTWHGRFFLGADQNGRDIAVRLLYGGRNSLEIGLVATLITMILATLIGRRRRLLPRRRRRRALPRARPASGPFPVVLLGDRARHVAGARRAQPRPVHAAGQLAAGARR